MERDAPGQDTPRFIPLFLLISRLLEALSYSPVTVGSGGEEQFGRQLAGCTESYLLNGALLAGEIRFTGFLSLFFPHPMWAAPTVLSLLFFAFLPKFLPYLNDQLA